MARGETSLDAAMRAPSTQAPNVVVLDFLDDDKVKKDSADPKKDLWLSSVDGRHQSAIIPIRVGPTAELFQVHRDILTKSAWFRRALDGDFREAGNQAIDLPVEDPTIFSFVVAYLYEEKFVPIKPIASVLVQDLDKGKGKEKDLNSASDDGTDSGTGMSDDSNHSHRRRQTRRRRQEREWTERQRKEPGRHRPDCQCNTCAGSENNTPCWNCGQTRNPPPPVPRFGVPPPPGYRAGPPRPRERRRGGRNAIPIVVDDPPLEQRMSAEDLRTWSLAYSLSVEVFVAAERYLMKDFKECIATYVINQFEIAGQDAANPAVLASCRTLYDGLSPNDSLVKKVFARVGFLQARLWKNFPEQTSSFFMENPEVTMLIMKEMVERREEDLKGDLPAMERSLPHLSSPPGFQPPRRPVYVNHHGAYVDD